MAARPILYSYFRSSASWRVRIALAYKGIEYDYNPVHLVKQEQKSDDYRNLNTMGQVPTLKINGLILNQSLPIIEYLDETHPENPLLPQDAAARAKVRAVAEIINSGIQPIQNLSVLNRLAEYTSDDKDKSKWGTEWITKGFEALERVLTETAGTYCVGDEVSMADCALVPQVYNANRFKVDMSRFPTIQQVHDNLVMLPAFIAADPKQQPDCPDELK